MYLKGATDRRPSGRSRKIYLLVVSLCFVYLRIDYFVSIPLFKFFCFDSFVGIVSFVSILLGGELDLGAKTKAEL